MPVFKSKLPPWCIICINKSAWLVSVHLKNYHKVDLSPQPAPGRDGMYQPPWTSLCAPLSTAHSSFCRDLILTSGSINWFCLRLHFIQTESAGCPLLGLLRHSTLCFQGSSLLDHPDVHRGCCLSILTAMTCSLSLHCHLSVLLMDVWMVHPDSCWTSADTSVLCPGTLACTSFG